MKKLLVSLVSVLLAALLLAACGTADRADKADTADTTASTPDTAVTETDEAAQPLYAEQLADGTYEISVQSSSSMFRVVRCVLTVAEGQMTAVMTMSGQGYGLLYMGTGEQALADTEENYIPFELNESGEKNFTVPVAALNVETDCAAWSIKNEQWYDRVLVFESAAIPAEAIKMEDQV